MIKSFEDLCKKNKWDSAKILPDVSMLPEKFQKATLAIVKLFFITEELNKDKEGNEWQPDWNKDDEYKYYPWFWMDEPGFRFCDSCCVITLTDAAGGSRLCFRTRKLAEYAAKTFIDLYKDLMVFEK